MCAHSCTHMCAHMTLLRPTVQDGGPDSGPQILAPPLASEKLSKSLSLGGSQPLRCKTGRDKAPGRAVAGVTWVAAGRAPATTACLSPGAAGCQSPQMQGSVRTTWIYSPTILEPGGTPAASLGSREAGSRGRTRSLTLPASRGCEFRGSGPHHSDLCLRRHTASWPPSCKRRCDYIKGPPG